MTSSPTEEHWRQECEELARSIEKLETEAHRFVEISEERAQLQGKCAADIASTYKSLRSLEEDLKRGRAKQTMSEPFVSQCREDLQKQREALGGLEEHLPHQTGLLLYLVLGEVNVTLPVMSDRFKYKTEYETFKLMITYIIIALSSLCLLLAFLNLPVRFAESLFHFLLLWYYGTLVVREHILIANGSKIRRWWRYHHYLAIVLSAILLVWPDSPSYSSFHVQFMAFSWYLGVVQLIQYRYQTALMYKKRALGTSRLMDTTTDLPVRGSFYSVLGVLVLVYTFQLYNAVTLFYVTRSSSEWQVLGAATIFLFLGVGNIYTTFRVVLGKKKTLGPGTKTQNKRSR